MPPDAEQPSSARSGAPSAAGGGAPFGRVGQLAVGLSAVAGAGLVQMVLNRLVGGGTVFLPFGVAVLLAAWYGRLAGAAAAVVSAGVAAFAFMPAPAVRPMVLAPSVFWFGAFMLTGLITTALVDSLQRGRRSAEAQAARARDAQRLLDEETNARRLTESAYLHLLRSDLFGVGVAGEDGRWLEANPALLGMLGQTWEDLRAGRAYWRGAIPLEDAVRRAAELGLSDAGASGPVEMDFVRQDGAAGTALLHLMAPAGYQSTLVLAVDITSRKHAERALRESEARLRLLVESLTDHAIFMIAPDGRVMSWNAGVERLLGYGGDEVIGRHFSIFHTTDEQQSGRPSTVLKTALREGRLEDDGWRVRKDGTRFWANTLLAPVHADGELIGFAKVMRDLSARHNADVLLKSIMDGATDGIIGIDEFGTVQSFNVAAERMFDHPADEVVGSGISKLLPEPYRSNFMEYLARYAHTGHARMAGRGRHLMGLRGDGTTFPLELAVSEFNLDGRRYFTGIVRDITRQRALEEQLQQAQKMHAIGQLAGGIAHDFNNLLTIIAGHTELLLTQHTEPNQLHNALTEIRDAGMRASGLTRQLLAFSRRAVLEPTVLDLNNVVRDTRKMLRRIIGEDIELVTRLDPALRQVNVDQGQIGQVLINLVVNARDAIPRGGRIEVETSNCEIAEGRNGHSEVRPGPCVMLTVRDHGVGMTPEVMQRIFEPFFTTKQAGAGTGLGLSMVYGIVKQSGGHIEVSSEPGAGTEFRVILPVAQDGAIETPRPRRLGDDSLAGSETLLVVEDEETVRRLAVLALRAHGYRVIEAGNGAEALRLLAGHEADIDMVVTDVVMPVMGGRQLIEALKPLRTNVRVLYVSGYTDDAVIRHGVQRAEVAFLQKPYTPHALAEKVRRVLDGTD